MRLVKRKMRFADHESNSGALADGFKFINVHALNRTLRQRVYEEFFTALIGRKLE